MRVDCTAFFPPCCGCGAARPTRAITPVAASRLLITPTPGASGIPRICRRRSPKRKSMTARQLRRNPGTGRVRRIARNRGGPQTFLWCRGRFSSCMKPGNCCAAGSDTGQSAAAGRRRFAAVTAPPPWNRCCNFVIHNSICRTSGLLLQARWRWLRRRSSHVAFAAILEATPPSPE